jgi:hypothetical protein
VVLGLVFGDIGKKREGLFILPCLTTQTQTLALTLLVFVREEIGE